MLFPRFSLRTILIAVSTCAVFSIVLGQAVRGEGWAIVVSVSVVSLCVILAFHAIVYLLSAGFTRLLTAQHTPAKTSRGGIQSTPDQQSAPSGHENTTGT
ncbi:MAG: hypothetical protein AAGD11_02555 [Planctomycetota bacterium]